MKSKLLRFVAVGLPSIALLISGCGGGSSGETAAAAVSYATINPPEAQSSGYVSVTGIRGVANSSDVYITGGYSTSSGAWSDQLYKGPILGGGAYFTMNYPSGTNATVNSTNSYSADNLPNGGVSLTGTYTTTQNGNLQGFLYQGPVINNPTSGWLTINFSGAEKTNPHSVMGDFVVGGYYVQGDPSIHAFIYQISTATMQPLKVFNDDVSTSAYGIWWNGGNSYTIVGGYARPGVASSGYVLDYDAATGTKSNITSYKYNNDATFITHFEGVTADLSGGYNLAGMGTGNDTVNGAFVHVSRLPGGGFTTQPKWISVKYPNSRTSTSDTVYQNKILGVYSPGFAVLNGYVATIPESMYQ